MKFSMVQGFENSVNEAPSHQEAKEEYSYDFINRGFIKEISDKPNMH